MFGEARRSVPFAIPANARMYELDLPRELWDGNDMKPRKPKSGEPSLREKLSQKFLEALEADFQLHGLTVLEKMRESSPERYAELAAKMIMSAEPPEQKDGFASDNSMEAIGRRLLKSVGLIEPDNTAIEAAIAANNRFIEQLEAIRDNALGGLNTNGHAAPIGAS